MPALLVQVQPIRSPGLDLDDVLALFASAAELADAELEISASEDDDPCVHFAFRTRDLPRLWSVLQGQVFWDRAIGPPLARSAIATCEGNHGWDDYLMLHHYDRSVELDELGGG